MPDILVRRRQVRELHGWLRAMHRAWRDVPADVEVGEVDWVVAARIEARERLHAILAEMEVAG